MVIRFFFIQLWKILIACFGNLKSSGVLKFALRLYGVARCLRVYLDIVTPCRLKCFNEECSFLLNYARALSTHQA